MKRMLIMLLIATGFVTVHAQGFLTPASSFSNKKTAYITFVDGEKAEGKVTEIVKKKNQITEVKFTYSNGKKENIPADEIHSMYLYPNNASRLVSSAKAYDRRLNQKLIEEGYAFIENVPLGNNNEVLLQLVNPDFSKGPKVYANPEDNTGKSYYVKLRSEQYPTLIKEKDYAKTGASLWKNCDVIGLRYPTIKWEDLLNHITVYNEKCTY